MSLSYLGALGAVEILRSAGSELTTRGFAHFMPCDPYTGTVNIVGALAIACGAKDKELKAWSGDMEFAPIPDTQYGLFMELISYVESVVDEDIDEWSISVDTQDCVKLLNRCATRIEISVI
jgi:hypothetical protein